MAQLTFGWALTDARCSSCRCYFDEHNLLPKDCGVLLCLDCINAELRSTELTDKELLRVDDENTDR